MPNAKLDHFFVQTAFCPEGKNKIDYYDTVITGFILEVRATGNKTYSVRYRDAHGTQRQYKIGNAADITFDKAKKEALKIKSRVTVGENPSEAKQAKRAVPTVEELSERFVAYVRTSKRSHANDERALTVHILPRFGKLRLDEVAQEDVALWLKSKVEDGYAKASVNFMHVVFGHMYKLARQWGVPGSAINPLAGIKHFEANNARDRYLTADEIKALRLAIEESENTQLRYLIPLLLLTGVRKTELMNAQWKDIDLENRRWRVPMTKSGKARHVPLSADAIAILKTVPRWEGCPYVLPNPRSKKPFSCFFLAWHNARKKVGLDDVRLHDLRHTAASNMVNAGQSLYVVGQVLGHTKPTTTQRYAHLSQEALLAAVDAGAKAMGTTWSQPHQA